MHYLDSGAVLEQAEIRRGASRYWCIFPKRSVGGSLYWPSGLPRDCPRHRQLSDETPLVGPVEEGIGAMSVTNALVCLP